MPIDFAINMRKKYQTTIFFCVWRLHSVISSGDYFLQFRVEITFCIFQWWLHSEISSGDYILQFPVEITFCIVQLKLLAGISMAYQRFPSQGVVSIDTSLRNQQFLNGLFSQLKITVGNIQIGYIESPTSVRTDKNKHSLFARKKIFCHEGPGTRLLSISSSYTSSIQYSTTSFMSELGWNMR